MFLYVAEIQLVLQRIDLFKDTNSLYTSVYDIVFVYTGFAADQRESQHL